MRCAGDSGHAAEPPTNAAPLRARASLTAGVSRSYLSFDGERDVTLDKVALIGTSDLFLGRYTLTLGAGGVPVGTLREERRADREVASGALATAGLAWQVVDEEGFVPYIVLGVSLSGLLARTQVGDLVGAYRALDFRFGVTAGKTLGGWFSPYLAARVFGGPAVWSERDATYFGTDRYHVQIALGAVAILPAGFDLFAEGAPLGEQGVFGGVGYRY